MEGIVSGVPEWDWADTVTIRLDVVFEVLEMQYDEPGTLENPAELVDFKPSIELFDAETIFVNGLALQELRAPKKCHVQHYSEEELAQECYDSAWPEV